MEKSNTDRICVQVFARISASISHEIKNTLSIINENAGLLDDFAQMANQDEGVAVERVRSVTEIIAKQVDRSNTIMKNLNRFAHSADTSLAHANLAETLSLVVFLTNRQAAMKNITVTLACPPDITFFTHLIYLESLIYLTLLSLFEKNAGGNLSIEAKYEAPDITVCFKVNNEDYLSPDTYPDNDHKLLFDQLHASCGTENNQLFLKFPAVVSE